jgi:hypothetical protein
MESHLMMALVFAIPILADVSGVGLVVAGFGCFENDEVVDMVCHLAHCR